MDLDNLIEEFEKIEEEMLLNKKEVILNEAAFENSNILVIDNHQLEPTKKIVEMDIS